MLVIEGILLTAKIRKKHSLLKTYLTQGDKEVARVVIISISQDCGIILTQGGV